jgi:ribosomal protein S27AE
MTASASTVRIRERWGSRETRLVKMPHRQRLTVGLGSTLTFCIHRETQVDLDLDRDKKACPECQSNAVKTTDELVDEECPVCEEGTVIAEDTGAIA